MIFFFLLGVGGGQEIVVWNDFMKVSWNLPSAQGGREEGRGEGLGGGSGQETIARNDFMKVSWGGG